MKSPASRIESIGYILKVENLSPVLYYVMENTLVMESLEPFPGYHGKHVPTSLKPRNIYLMVKYGYDFEEIARLSREIHKSFPYRFSGTPAEIEIGNKRCHAIRIKFLESFEMVTELQGLYKDAGIRFRKFKRLEGSARIKVHRYFLVEETTPGIFRDLQEAEQFYLEIPVLLRWKSFEAITRDVKNNVDNSNFDAALGMMYRYECPVELIRIWARDQTPERAIQLREKYLEFIHRAEI